MSKIQLSIPDVITNGKQISFTAPCGSSAVTALVINSTEYTICDANGNNLGQTDGLWSANAIVSVILDTENNKAFVQNANTNAYLESKLVPKGSLSDLGITESCSTYQLLSSLPFNTMYCFTHSSSDSIKVTDLPATTGMVIVFKGSDQYSHFALMQERGTGALHIFSDYGSGGYWTSFYSSMSNLVLNSRHYGTTLPSAGTAGRLFFKKV